MDILEISELQHLTREELLNVAARLGVMLRHFEPGTVARTNALRSLGNIRRVMLLRGYSF